MTTQNKYWKDKSGRFGGLRCFSKCSSVLKAMVKMEKTIVSTRGTSTRWRSAFAPFLMLFPLGLKSISVLAWALKVQPCFGNSSPEAWERHDATLENVVSAFLRGCPSPVAAGQDRLVPHCTLAFRESCRCSKAYLVSCVFVDSFCHSLGYSQLSGSPYPASSYHVPRGCASKVHTA